MMRLPQCAKDSPPPPLPPPVILNIKLTSPKGHWSDRKIRTVIDWRFQQGYFPQVCQHDDGRCDKTMPFSTSALIFLTFRFFLLFFDIKFPISDDVSRADEVVTLMNICISDREVLLDIQCHYPADDILVVYVAYHVAA